MHDPKNVLGGRLELCSDSPLTGFYRTGCCEVGPDDHGVHAVCAQMTEEFLAFSRAAGNDLTTPTEDFPGLQPGDRWCLCATRWKQAYDAGVAPPVYLAATHEATLGVVSLETLVEYATDLC